MRVPLGHGGANPSVPAQSGARGGKRAPPPAFQGLEGRVWLEAASGFDRRIRGLTGQNEGPDQDAQAGTTSDDAKD
jgi:hypothetical protein